MEAEFCRSFSQAYQVLGGAFVQRFLEGRMWVGTKMMAFFDNLLDHDVRYVSSFEYRLNGDPHEMDFGIIASTILRPEAEMIFGESKSGAALKEEERNKLKSFAESTGA